MFDANKWRVVRRAQYARDRLQIRAQHAPNREPEAYDMQELAEILAELAERVYELETERDTRGKR